MKSQVIAGVQDEILLWKLLQYRVLFSAEGCDVNCVRRRSEKRLRKTIRTLRKSINREQFHLHFAGADYDLSRSPGQLAELPGHCVAGQMLLGRKCGEWSLCVECLFTVEIPLTSRTQTVNPGKTSTGNVNAFHLSHRFVF